ncbi:MAG: Iron-sulfur cluster-binding protein, partial [uncultured Thermomicrobiales bacterium]
GAGDLRARHAPAVGTRSSAARQRGDRTGRGRHGGRGPVPSAGHWRTDHGGPAGRDHRREPGDRPDRRSPGGGRRGGPDPRRRAVHRPGDGQSRRCDGPEPDRPAPPLRHHRDV